MERATLHLFTGSGGVGKTTLSASWALALAHRGEKVALITIDPAKRLAQALGLRTLSGSLAKTKLHPNLWAMMLDRAATSRRLVETYAQDVQISNKILSNRYYQAFSTSLAGVQEMMAIHEVYEALSCGQYDAVVLDTPPAQHALDLLEVPKRLQTALESPALGWLVGAQSDDPKSKRGLRHSIAGLSKTVAVKAFTKMTAGAFVEDLFEFIRLFGDVLTKIKNHGVSLERALRETNSYLWVVSAPDNASLRASSEVIHHLNAKGFMVRSTLINRTPALLTTIDQDQTLDDALRQGINQLSLALGDQAHLKALSLSILQEEIDRARDAAALIKSHVQSVPTTLIQELNSMLTPADMVRELSQMVSKLDEFEETLRRH
jgi:anion-transporting  ArsA/GET3 family ATPase